MNAVDFVMDVLICQLDHNILYEQVEGVTFVQAASLIPLLGFRNITETLERHVWAEFKVKHSFGNAGHPSWFLNEAGLKQLLLASKADIARDYQLALYTHQFQPRSTVDDSEGTKTPEGDLKARITQKMLELSILVDSLNS